MTYFTIVLGQIFIFIIYAVIGILAVKTKILDKEGLGVLSRFITRIALPLLIFTNTINGATREQFLGAVPIMLATVLMYLLLYLLALVLARISKLQGNEKNVYRACSIFGNNGFMGIPIVSALFPEQGLLYIALFTVVDQMVLWTTVVTLTAPVEQQNGMCFSDKVKKMINPATVGIVLAVLGIFLNVKLPAALNTALTKTGAISTPLAMIYLGGIFCYTDIPKYLKKAEIYATVLLKMCLFPIAFFYLLKLIPGITQDIAVTMSVLSALPTMTFVAMLAQIQKSADEYSAGMIFVTTLFSIVTLPLVCLIIG